MTIENTPRGVEVAGTLTVVLADKEDIVDPSAPTAAELNAGTRLTYSMIGGGYNRTTDQATETDERETLKEVPETPGAITNTLELTYVYGSDEDVADTAITEGKQVYVVERRAVDNGEDFEAGQKVDVLAGVWGKPRKNAPSTNSKWTKTTKLFVQRTFDDVAVVA